VEARAVDIKQKRGGGMHLQGVDLKAASYHGRKRTKCCGSYPAASKITWGEKTSIRSSIGTQPQTEKESQSRVSTSHDSATGEGKGRIVKSWSGMEEGVSLVSLRLSLGTLSRGGQYKEDEFQKWYKSGTEGGEALQK